VETVSLDTWIQQYFGELLLLANGITQLFPFLQCPRIKL